MIKEIFTQDEYNGLLENSDLLEKSSLITKRLFKDAKDKGGKPYQEHLSFIESEVESIEEKVMALMHDAIEDYNVKEEELLELGFPQNIVEGIVILTRKKNEDYNDYIERIINSNNFHVLNVKLADLTNNMDISKITNPTVKDFARIEQRYRPAYIKIENKLNELKGENK